jgi:hypothetical protein
MCLTRNFSNHYQPGTPIQQTDSGWGVNNEMMRYANKYHVNYLHLLSFHPNSS